MLPLAADQQWNQYSVTNGSVTTHTFMNPQSGEVAAGQSIRSGNTTYHFGPGFSGTSKREGTVTTHQFTDTRTGAVSGGASTSSGNKTSTHSPGYSNYPTQSGGTTSNTFTRSPKR